MSRMHSVRGFYGGIDSISIGDSGQFDSMSWIARRNENVCIRNRADIRQLVEYMGQKQDVIPGWVAKGLMDAAFDDKELELGKLQSRWEASTFVTLEDSIKLQVMNKSDGFDSVDVLDEHGERKSVQFRGQWPKKLTWLHNATKHGASLPRLPVLRVKSVDCRLLWITLAMHVCVPKIWESSVACLSFAEDWHGWMLTYLTCRCLRVRGKRGSGSPFSFRARCSQESQDSKLVSVF